MLNHVLTGILLIPLGYTTWLASSPSHVAQSWAKRVLIVNSIIVLALPLSIVTFMREPAYYHAPLFVTGMTLAAILPVMMIAATCLTTRPARSR